jgi:hypothetical protein
MALDPIPIGGDYALALTGLTGGGSYLNSATVTYELKAPSGTVVGSGTLAYTAASNGNYTATIESTVTGGLVATFRYRLCVTIAQSTFNDYREASVSAYLRGLV